MYSKIHLRKTKCIVMMTMKPSIKIVKFVTLASGVRPYGEINMTI